MKYIGGDEIRLGDRVRLGADADGVVVCAFDSDEYAEGYLKAEWSYLRLGVLIKFPKYGLIHYQHIEPTLTLVDRA